MEEKQGTLLELGVQKAHWMTKLRGVDGVNRPVHAVLINAASFTPLTATSVACSSFAVFFSCSRVGREVKA